MYLKIILLTVAIGAILKILADRFEKLKPHSWWVGLVGAMATAIVCIVAFWQPEVEPLTQNAFEKTSDSLQTELMCRFDSLEARLRSPSTSEKPDSTYRAQTRALSECLDSIAQTALEKGMVAIGLEKYDEALTHLDYALAAAGEDLTRRGEVFYYMGLTYTYQGKSTLAINCYDSCTIYRPHTPEAWNNRGYVLNKLERHNEAIASCDSALAYNPTLNEAWINRGNALHELGRIKEAIASFESALSNKPDMLVAWFNRGNELAVLGLVEEAIASYDSALAYSPGEPEVWDGRGVALGKLGRYEGAIASFDSALNYKHDYHEAWYNRGIALDRLVRHDEAIASYDSALIYKPDKHQAWYNRAITLARLNRFEEALSSCDSSLKYDPNDSSTVELRQLIMELMRLMNE